MADLPFFSLRWWYADRTGSSRAKGGNAAAHPLYWVVRPWTSTQRIAGAMIRSLPIRILSLSKHRLREGDRHILLRGLRKMCQSPTVFG